MKYLYQNLKIYQIFIIQMNKMYFVNMRSYLNVVINYFKYSQNKITY